MFLWMMPMPPSCAMVIASRASVTVSIAADTNGMLSRMPRVRRVDEVDLARQDVRVRGDEQDVVEGECFLDDSHFRHSPGRSEMKRRIVRSTHPQL